MDIQGIKGKYVKVHKTSISCVDAEGKTRGIVKNIALVSDLPPRQKFDFASVLRSSGLWGNDMAERAGRTVIADGRLVYIRDLGYAEHRANMADAGLEVDVSERYKAFLDRVQDSVEVIDAYIRR